MKPSQIIEALQFLVAIQQPAMIWGPPGVGKSMTMQNLVDTINKTVKKKGEQWSLIDQRLSQCDPTDMKGFPMPDAAKGVMRFLPMASLPTSGYGVLLLDEINQAPPAVAAAAYQLVLDRRLGDYVLPAGWVVLAAGNRATDRSGVNAMGAALASRFVHLDFTVDHEDWVDWALDHGVSEITTGYIRMQPADLVTEKIEAGARAFPNPRAWVKADKIAQSGLRPEIMIPLLQGTIGEGVTGKYIGFIRERAHLPNLDRVLINPDDVPVPESPSVRFAALAGLEARVTPANFGRILKYVKRMGKDFETVFCTAADRRDKTISETQEFVAWMRENRNVLMG
jgi:hypothetical protein